MNAYKDYRYLFFNIASTSPGQLVDIIREGFNGPHPMRETDEDGNNLVTYHSQTCELDLSRAYVDCPIAGDAPLQAMFWAPRNAPHSTVFMSNTSDAMSFAVFKISKRTEFRWIHVELRDVVFDFYPAVAFEFYDNFARSIRTISASVQSSWEFHEYGDMLPFENPAYYKRRKIRDRLTREIVVEYLGKLGYHITEDDFWQTDQPAYYLWEDRSRLLEKRAEKRTDPNPK